MKEDLTISEALSGLKNGEFSSVEITTHYLRRIEESSELNAYITVADDAAIEAAKLADGKRAKNEAGSLLGVPIAVKDLFCTKGIRTTAGSRILSDFTPPYESTVTQNLLSQGAVFLGKTNMDEFAMGSSNATSYFGPCHLPFRGKSGEKLVPGGSSGGSAVAVSADLCVAATGSDTGGSIRQPAAFSGITGIKPTYGLCSRLGMVAFASSLDQAGPMTKTVEDAAIMLGAMAGYDPNDSTSAKVEIPEYTAFLGQPVAGMRIGIVSEYMDGLSPDVADLIEKAKRWFVEAGAKIVEISLKTAPYALPAYYVIAPAEASSNLARYDGVRYAARAAKPANIEELYVDSRTEGFGEEVKRRILAGTYVLSAGYYDAYYMRALKIQRLIKRDFEENGFANVDLILAPTTPTAAFAASKSTALSPVEMYLNDVFTVGVNIAGLPAMSVPAGFSSDGLPLGVQLIGDKFREDLIFKAAHVVEKCADFKANFGKIRRDAAGG